MVISTGHFALSVEELHAAEARLWTNNKFNE